MRGYQLAYQLDRLNVEGKRFADSAEGEGVEATALRTWLADVSDVLKTVLPADSALLDEIKPIRAGLIDTAERLPAEQTRSVMRKVLEILDRAREINVLQSSKPESRDLEREIRSIFIESYVRSPWFYIPIVVLGIAAVFAVTGVVQIQGAAIDFRQTAATEIKRVTKETKERADSAKATIAQSEEEVTRDLSKGVSTLIETERKRVSTKLDGFVEDLKKEKAPGLERTLSAIAETANAVKTKGNEATKTIETLTASTVPKLIRDLESYAQTEEKRVSKELDQFLEEQKKQVAPALALRMATISRSVDDLGAVIGPLENQLMALQRDLSPLVRAFEQSRSSDRGVLTEVSEILQKSSLYLKIVIGVSLAAILASLLALFLVVWFRPAKPVGPSGKN